MGSKMMRRGWSVLDLIIIILNFSVTVLILVEANLVATRILEAALCFLLLMKSLYFMQLIDEIAPYVNIIFVILNDISYFMMIFIIFILAFSTVFYLLGRNQLYLLSQVAEEERG